MSDLYLHWPVQIVIAFALDILLGDPEYCFHPVRWIGKAIEKLEPTLRGRFSNLYFSGSLLAILVIGGAALGTWLILAVITHLSVWLGVLFRIYFFYACLGAGCLANEVRSVLCALRTGNLCDARSRLSRIVGRDTRESDEKEILRALVETTAESTVDGIVSVLFYAFLGGPVLAMAFKAASTLDSTVGYKNERYREFGWASARTDDVLNYLPARLGALFICLASFATGDSARRALITVIQDAQSQPSPNSGYSEAAFAGALGIQLGGRNVYQGKSMNKAFLGHPIKNLSVTIAERALRLMFATAILSLFAGVLLSHALSTASGTIRIN